MGKPGKGGSGKPPKPNPQYPSKERDKPSGPRRGNKPKDR